MSSQLFSFVANGISPYAPGRDEGPVMPPPIPRFFCAEGPASERLASVYLELSHVVGKEYGPPMVVRTSVKDMAALFDGKIRENELLVAYDEISSHNSLRFDGVHTLPRSMSDLKPFWCVGVPTRWKLDEYQEHIGDSVRRLRAIFTEENLRISAKEWRRPWGSAFPKKILEGVVKGGAGIPAHFFRAQIESPLGK